MGQHKHNPTAIAAKEGKLPPKPSKPSAKERRQEEERIFRKAVRDRAPVLAAMLDVVSIKDPTIP